MRPAAFSKNGAQATRGVAPGKEETMVRLEWRGGMFEEFETLEQARRAVMVIFPRAIAQPWGKTVAVDLNSGDIRWETPAATFSFGGVLITGGGVVFLSGGLDQKFRALDIDNGKELWSATLPAGGQSTPMSYRLPGGKQYVVIAAGGHGDLPVKLGDYLVAYALP